jgi:CHASE2 domain
MAHWLLSYPRVVTVIIEAGLALAAFVIDPLEFSEQKHRAVDHGLAVATQYLRAEPPQELAVVLIDRPTLNDWKTDWPITYGKMAELVHTFACAGARGVFFDFAASRQFNLVEGQNDLRAAVEDSSRYGPICANGGRPARLPVYFGRIEDVKSPLNQWLDQRGSTFLLNTGEEDGIYQSGRDKFPARAVPAHEITPAFGLMRAIERMRGSAKQDDGAPCGSDDPRVGCWSKPLAMVWGAAIDPAQARVSDVSRCRGNRGLAALILGLTPLGAGNRYESCPPVLTLTGKSLYPDLNFIDAHDDPLEFLAGRIVMVGVNLVGLNDQIATPVHEYLPGVYKHAVALGALMHYGQHYPTVPQPAVLIVLVAAIYLLLEAAREWLAGRRHGHWLLIGVLAICFIGFLTLIYWQRWPASLLVAVFGYYLGVVGAIFAAARARKVAREPASNPKQVATEECKS